MSSIFDYILLIHNNYTNNLYDDLKKNSKSVISLKDYGGNHLIHHYCLNNFYVATELLISFGSDVNVQNLECKTPLYDAVLAKDIDICRLLLKNGANKSLMIPNSNPLILALKLEFNQAVQLFLNEKFNTCVMYEGCNLLYYTIKQKKWDIMFTLLLRGVNPNHVADTRNLYKFQEILQNNLNFNVIKILYQFGMNLLKFKEILDTYPMVLIRQVAQPLSLMSSSRLSILRATNFNISQISTNIFNLPLKLESFLQFSDLQIPLEI